MTWAGLTPPYRTIVADPPWSYNATVKELRSGGRGGQAEHQYGFTPDPVPHYNRGRTRLDLNV